MKFNSLIIFSKNSLGIRKKECVQKRRLGRNPRIPFSTEQVALLEEKFQISPYLSNTDVIELSRCLQLSESRVSVMLIRYLTTYLSIEAMLITLFISCIFADKDMVSK